MLSISGDCLVTDEESFIGCPPIADVAYFDTARVVLGIDDIIARRRDCEVVDVAVGDSAAMEQQSVVPDFALQIRSESALAITALAERSDVLRLVAEELGEWRESPPLSLEVIIVLCLATLVLTLRPRTGVTDVDDRVKFVAPRFEQ